MDQDKALEIIRPYFTKEIKAGGLVTLYGYPEHWLANCTFPDQKNNGAAFGSWFKISRADGSVTPIEKQ